MVRICAVVALFSARLMVAVFDLGTPEPPAGLNASIPVNHQAAAELPPTIISGLPEDAGTLRR